MLNVEKTNLKGIGLCLLDKTRLLYYRKGKLMFYSLEENKTYKKVKLPISLWLQMACQFRIIERLLHFPPRWVTKVNDDELLVQFGKNKIMSYNLKYDTWSKEAVEAKGKPFSYLILKGVKGFKDSIVVWDYAGNPEREEVNIYRREINGGKWRAIFTFPRGTIRHIHNVIADADNCVVYILTGDENKEAGFWRATNDFQEVVPILCGSQKTRSCQMLPLQKGFFYLTDAPSETNYLCRYSEGEISSLSRIMGTCIYGVNIGTGLLCSTTVEPDAHAKNIITYWLSNKPGKGIAGREFSVLWIDSEGKIEILDKFQHDKLPLRLFQYGTVLFTNSYDGRVIYTPICAKGKDCNIYMIDYI